MDNHSYAVDGRYVDKKVEKDENTPIKFAMHRFSFTIEAEDIPGAYGIAMAYMPQGAEVTSIFLTC